MRDLLRKAIDSVDPQLQEMARNWLGNCGGQASPLEIDGFITAVELAISQAIDAELMRAAAERLTASAKPAGQGASATPAASPHAENAQGPYSAPEGQE